MAKSLLFIPDISGFTHFVQTTEAEHSQHVIAELLEVIIAANTLQLKLAEIEGDALFFYKEGSIPSQEQLLAQVESMYTAFYSHLRLLEKHRICPCNACATAPKLQLKIIVHLGDLQFLEVQGSRKPFGESVIKAHRLLKNSIPSDNYVLFSNDLMDHIAMPVGYESMLFCFRESVDSYDNISTHYSFSEVATSKLKLKAFDEGLVVNLDYRPRLEITKKFPMSAEKLIEFITNYKYRHTWALHVEKVAWNENEITRIGSEHTCTVGGKQLNFIAVTKKAAPEETVYGELTTSPAAVDKLYQFFTVKPVSDTTSILTYEMYWEAKSPLKKIMLATFGNNYFKKRGNETMISLEREVSKYYRKSPKSR